VVAIGVDPPGQEDLLAGVLGAKCAAGVRPLMVRKGHGFVSPKDQCID
jgi:hypothetical protein